MKEPRRSCQEALISSCSLIKPSLKWRRYVSSDVPWLSWHWQQSRLNGTWPLLIWYCQSASSICSFVDKAINPFGWRSVRSVQLDLELAFRFMSSSRAALLISCRRCRWRASLRSKICNTGAHSAKCRRARWIWRCGPAPLKLPDCDQICQHRGRFYRMWPSTFWSQWMNCNPHLSAKFQRFQPFISMARFWTWDVLEIFCTWDVLQTYLWDLNLWCIYTCEMYLWCHSS